MLTEVICILVILTEPWRSQKIPWMGEQDRPWDVHDGPM